MIIKTLTKFIKKRLRKGFSKEEITAELSGIGWKIEEIEQSFWAASQKRFDFSRVKELYKAHTTLSIVILVILALAVLGFIYRDRLPIVEIVPGSFSIKNCYPEDGREMPKYFREGSKYFWQDARGTASGNMERRVIQEIPKEEYIREYRSNAEMECDISLPADFPEDLPSDLPVEEGY